jgi:hypothetical protein
LLFGELAVEAQRRCQQFLPQRLQAWGGEQLFVGDAAEVFVHGAPSASRAGIGSVALSRGQFRLPLGLFAQVVLTIAGGCGLGLGLDCLL